MRCLPSPTEKSDIASHFHLDYLGVQWLSGRVLDSRLRDYGIKPQPHHCNAH